MAETPIKPPSIGLMKFNRSLSHFKGTPGAMLAGAIGGGTLGTLIGFNDSKGQIGSSMASQGTTGAMLGTGLGAALGIKSGLSRAGGISGLSKELGLFSERNAQKAYKPWAQTDLDTARKSLPPVSTNRNKMKESFLSKREKTENSLNNFMPARTPSSSILNTPMPFIGRDRLPDDFNLDMPTRFPLRDDWHSSISSSF